VPPDAAADADVTTVPGTTTSSTSSEATQSVQDDSSASGSSRGADATTGQRGESTTLGTAGSSSGTGTRLGLDLALHLELEDAAFAASIVDSGPHDLAVSCDACPTPTPGRFGQGASFAGADQCIVVAHDAVFDDLAGLTISVWVRPNDAVVANNKMIVGKPLGDLNSNSFELYLFDAVADDDQLQLRFVIVDDEEATAVAPELITVGGDWIHVAGTWDGADVGLWVDGVEVGSQPMPGIALDDGAVLVGCDDDPGGPVHDNVFEGSLDDVRIYREALSTEQIAALASGAEP
jgi:hypothetical protein